MGVPTVVAQTDEEAEYLATSAYQRVLGLMRGQSLKLKAPVETMEGIWSPAEKMSVDNFYAMGQVGSAETVKAGLEKLLEKYNVDEFIFTCDIYDTDKRIQNFELLMDIKNS
jgi:alkanesulfonate monooxygenase SsuD/methylene tetrahydromethanopterin reductase-like flavin-dependent oxidoreductase (luciferase family)